jgi:hypothetical protein
MAVGFLFAGSESSRWFVSTPDSRRRALRLVVAAVDRDRGTRGRASRARGAAASCRWPRSEVDVIAPVLSCGLKRVVHFVPRRVARRGVIEEDMCDAIVVRGDGISSELACGGREQLIGAFSRMSDDDADWYKRHLVSVARPRATGRDSQGKATNLPPHPREHVFTLPRLDQARTVRSNQSESTSSEANSTCAASGKETDVALSQ